MQIVPNNINPNNIIFIIKPTKATVVTLSAKETQKLTKLFSKGFFYWNEYKTKSENKNTTGECR